MSGAPHNIFLSARFHSFTIFQCLKAFALEIFFRFINVYRRESLVPLALARSTSFRASSSHGEHAESHMDPLPFHGPTLGLVQPDTCLWL